MTLNKQEGVITCNDHPNSKISHVDINNYSTKKLLCSKCIKNNQLIEECEIVSFDSFAECMNIIQSNFWDITESSMTTEEVMKVFNGICPDEKIETFIKDSSSISTQFRARIFTQIQDACELFLKNLQESMNNFRNKLQDNLKGMLSNYFQARQYPQEQVKAAGIIAAAIQEKKSHNEIEGLIKQLHSGKLELKLTLDGLNATQAQIKSTLNDLLDSQKKVIDSSLVALNLLIPPQTEVNTPQENSQNHSIQLNRIKSQKQFSDSPLKFMRLTQLNQSNARTTQFINHQNEQISPIKKHSQNNTSLSNSINSSIQKRNTNQTLFPKQQLLQQCSKGNQQIYSTIQQKSIFQDRITNSLNTIDLFCDKKPMINSINLTPISREEDRNGNKIKSLCETDNLFSEIRKLPSPKEDENDSLLQVKKGIGKNVCETKINKEEKKALIQSLYYPNIYSNSLTQKINEKEKSTPSESQYECNQPNHSTKGQLNQSISHPSFKISTTFEQNSLSSTQQQQLKVVSKSEQSSPTSSSLTICQTIGNKENINCIFKMDNSTLIAGTQSGKLLVCDISSAQNCTSSIEEISIKSQTSAHKNVTFLSQCPSNTSMFFSVGQFKEKSSSIKLWSLGNKFNLSEVAELRDFHQSPIDQILVLKEETIKDTSLLNKNTDLSNLSSSSVEQRIESISQQKSLVNEITLATFSKTDSLKIWKISYKDSNLKNGVVMKLIDVSLKNLNIKSDLLLIGQKLYITNANKIICYEFNQDYSAIQNEIKIDLFVKSDQNEFIQYVTATNSLIGVLSNRSQFVILTEGLIQKGTILNFSQSLFSSNKQLEPEQIFISHLIPLQNDHFGIGYRYEKANQKVSIINGLTCKQKQVMNLFDNSLTLIQGINSDYQVILVEGNKTIKIQKSWINQNKVKITFQK